MIMTAKDVKEITYMPLVTFVSVLERPVKTVRRVATTKQQQQNVKIRLYMKTHFDMIVRLTYDYILH